MTKEFDLKGWMNMARTARSTAAAVAVVTSVAVLTAACGSSAKKTQGTAKAVAPTTTGAAQSPTPSPSPTTPPLTFSATVPTISDGSDVVVINHQRVTFPGPVTDAVWAPDGTRLAYVDGNGDIAVAHPDGTGVRVLTTAASGVKRARPAWSADGGTIYFDEQTPGGASQIKSVAATATTPGAESDWRWDGYGPRTFTEPAKGSSVAEVSLDTDRKVSSYDGPGSKPYPALVYAAQVGTGTSAALWIGDANGRGSYTARFGTAGSEPAISPDGSEFVFVGTNGQIFEAKPESKASSTVQISFGVASPSHLVWSPDGTRIAFSTAGDVESIAATVPAGAKSNPTTQESATPGVATYQRVADPLSIHEVTGGDLVDAAIAVSRTVNPTMKTAADWNPFADDTHNGPVIVATGSDLEAEAASTLPGQLLFTKPGELDPRVAAELNRMYGPCLRPPAQSSCADNHIVIPIRIVGTPAQIPLTVDAQLKALGYAVTRIDATDPYRISLTGAPIAPAPGYAPRTVAIVAADDSASQLEWRADLRISTVVFTHGASMPDSVKSFLNGLPATMKITTYGTEAATAFASSWTGRPAALHATAATPPAQFTTFVAPQSPLWQAALTLTGDVLMADPARLPTSLTATLDATATAIPSVTVIGDVSPWTTPLAAALVTPFPPVVTQGS